MKTRHVVINLIGYSATLALAGCSSVFNPTDDQAKSVFLGRLTKDIGDTPYTIDEFTKTDGQAANIMGVAVYHYFYQAKVTLPQGLHPECVYKGVPSPPRCAWIPIGGTPPKDAGSSLIYTGEVDFQKTENGWIASLS